MTNMHELGPIEDFVVLLTFDVGTHEAADPIVCDHDRREYLELAKGLESDEGKKDELFGDVGCSFSIVRLREEFRVMEPDVVDSAVLASMDAELILKVSSCDLHISFIFKPISQQVIGFLLLIVLVIRSDNVHFLA